MMSMQKETLTEKICIKCEWNYQIHDYIDHCSICKKIKGGYDG